MKMWAKCLLVGLLLGSVTAEVIIPQVATAQTTKPKPKRKPVRKKKPPVTTAAQVKAVDTTAVAVAPAKHELPVIGDTIRRSLRNDGAVERNLVKDRVPLPYQHIREDDAVYRQRVWEEIDTRQKINLPFRYKAQEDNGDQRFIAILINAIRDSSVTAFDPLDDRFTTPITTDKIAEELVGKADTVPLIDPQTGLKRKDTVITNDFNPDDIIKYQVKEEWVFDKQSSRMFCRILGIAPLKIIRREDGTELGETPLFWVYYPDLRPVLAKYEAYNGHNFGSRMTWEELFENRMFSGYVVKSTIDNPFDRSISQYVKDPILRLLESDRTKEKIFNYEQDLWSY
ncbi:type IX secretion system ring subunit PorN/GldN [Dinghuibacter silviterrae]|uniref:Gliding motility associated protein GldN n=1 Tax=Dinghuibacter silviterrae TaxID=1539049 RepID=A0A4R8DQM6_9BACT|nr:gliding motility protein GldN [Dinghuibacter silviterrae]TDX00096.1 gliding motility associated protein GldN [Dinghuibacter silviterrae]